MDCPQKGEKGAIPRHSLAVQLQSASHRLWKKESCAQPSFAAGMCSDPKALCCSAIVCDVGQLEAHSRKPPQDWEVNGSRGAAASAVGLSISLLEELCVLCSPALAPATALRI